MRPPSVDALARSIADVGLPHPMLVDAARAAIAAGDPDGARAGALAVRRRLLRPVVNATGVLLHTNLGRAPVAWSVPATATNLELDLDTGRRGSRQAHAGALLARACGAEAAMVVNNGAAAVLLVLAALARDRGVVVSRGELVEIGGGFRVPEVMAESGARLVEVGTTNRTRRADYERAVADPGHAAAMVLKVHQSNYRITGFTEAVDVADLTGLGVPVVDDIGSGLLDAACPWLPGGPPEWLRDEPAARQTLERGADLVIFSGDKLLGGPQAGVIAGSAELVRTCGAHPLARAVRPGGATLAVLQELALTYLRRDGAAIPFWRMATEPVERLRARADALGVGAVVDTTAIPGGGTLPGVEIASVGVALEGDHADALRANDPPVIARVDDGRTLCDLRTVDPDDDAALAAALVAVAGP
ncbi:MAG TPA: L-seryl-tRNA(Sec) selenium transferase [Acidimicrobiales bacterium]|nr:L-seryl-tRNA(Sec) selenium transferase [Acidimicrobiales bacterium]